MAYAGFVTPGGRLLRRSSDPKNLPFLFAAQFVLSHVGWSLAYPREVLSTLWNGRPWQLVVAPIVAAAALGSGWTRAWRLFARPQPAAPWIQRAVCAVLVLLLSALGARSTLGHRPLNPAMVAFSANPLVNQLPLNSFYALANATRQWLKQEDSAMDLYGPLPEKDVVAAVRATSGLPDIAFTNPDIPTLAARVPTYSGKPTPSG